MGPGQKNVNVLNDFIIENLGGIQFMVNSQTNVSNNFYDSL